MRLGGQISRSCVTLRIAGDSLVPSEVTASMGTQPTHSHAMGERISPRVSSLRKSGMWMLEFSEKSGQVEEQLSMLLDLIPPESTWLELQREFETDLVCSVTASGDSQGFSLSQATIEQLSRLKIDVMFEVWVDLDEEADGTGDPVETSN